MCSRAHTSSATAHGACYGRRVCACVCVHLEGLNVEVLGLELELERIIGLLQLALLLAQFFPFLQHHPYHLVLDLGRQRRCAGESLAHTHTPIRCVYARSRAHSHAQVTRMYHMTRRQHEANTHTHMPYLQKTSHFIQLTSACHALLRPRSIFPPRCRGSSTHPHVP